MVLIDSLIYENNPLFRVIGGVCKNPWIEPAHDPITAFYHDTMFVSFDKFRIKDDRPLCMQHFAAAVCHKGFAGCSCSYIWSGEVLECVRKLHKTVR
jgi:hypothetical protein